MTTEQLGQGLSAMWPRAIDASEETGCVLKGADLGCGVRAEHVVVQAVDAALLLGCRGTQFHANSTGRRARRHLVEVADAHVLEARAMPWRR